ncbi:MAG: hypothetical protein K9M49_06875 [Candidatus Marinimicrobia bacterium]|nr:hypothetical protein [Candidatus Neomarinimicrobiota bacterium]MCF7904862.1 hypothetical protein [Candidatus Neomarinimicrobiota bacterium]
MNIMRQISIQARLFTLLLASLIFIGCTEELSIADFADDFKDYEVELRIEGVLDQQEFSNSVIRIDRTILVTDTSLFNGIDDNGDWVSYTDVNGNGRWDEGEPLNDDIGGEYQGPNEPPVGRGNGIPDPGEPHMDDYIEILPQIHDSTMVAVVLRDSATSALVAEFVWKSDAGTFDVSFGPGGPPEVAAQNPYIRYTYGGYVPDTPYAGVELDSNRIYSVEITTTDGRVISASTDIITQPKVLPWDYTFWDDDTLVSPVNNFAYLTWNNPSESVYSSLKLDLFFRPDSIKGFYSYARAAFQLDPETNLPLFQESFLGYPLGMYRLTISTLNNSYGRYLYSGLPLRDRSLSNWRDQDGSVVLGALGSKSSSTFYLRLAAVNG